MWRIYENFHFWYMQEVLRLVERYHYVCRLTDMEKVVVSLHDMSVEAFTNFSHFSCSMQLPGQTVERDQVSRLKQLVSQCPSNVRVMVESE